jgi:hypothetical protein
VLENSRVTIADLIPAEYSLKIVPLDSGLYRVWEEKVKVLAGEMVKRNAEIKPLFKTVYLIANVLNTKIDIDDEYWGVISPGKEAKLELPLGLHNLKASAEGFLDTLVSISILKSDLNKTETLSLNMKKVPVYSILKVASRKNTGKVEINNIYCGVFPGTFDKIIPGMTNISLIANDGTKWDSTFMTDGGEEYNLNYDLLVPPKYGSVFIDSNPQFAHIYINGIDTHDDTPCIIDQIAVGNNAIRIEFHTNCYIDTTINITGNDTLKIFISQNKE